MAAFERLMIGSLEPSADIDRGAERLLRLTRFLSRRLRDLRAADRGDRACRRARPARVDCARSRTRTRIPDPGSTAPAYRHVVVTVPDQAADPRGLWLADYDLLARMPGLERLDIVATENVLAAGFHQRVHDVLPGIEEERVGAPAPLPVLSRPGAAGRRRDRSLDRLPRSRGGARETSRESRSDVPTAPLERTAVVFQRPLPYLYLARQVFPDAEIPYQALDALPLAAEPFAAALDLVFSFAIAEGTRASLVELLASPHWTFQIDGRPIEREDVAAADARLRDVKYVGGWERLASLATDPRTCVCRCGTPAARVEVDACVVRRCAPRRWRPTNCGR